MAKTKVSVKHIHVDKNAGPDVSEFECPPNFIPDYDAAIPDQYIVAFSTAENGLRLADAWKEAQELGKFTKVMVAAPSNHRERIQSSHAEARNVMREVIFDGLPPQHGGLRPVRPKDYNHYKLLAEQMYAEMKIRKMFKDNPNPSPEEQKEAQEGMCGTREGIAYCASHPLWPRVRWIHGVTPGWFAAVISLLEDPCWYVNPDHPKRMGRFKSHMGLYRFLDVMSDPGLDHTAYRLLTLMMTVVANIPPSMMEDKDTLKVEPKLFFQRYLLRARSALDRANVTSDQVAYRGLVAAINKLTSWVWLNWNEVLFPENAAQEVEAAKFFVNDKPAAQLSEHHRIW
jgi:hypothetical protein